MSLVCLHCEQAPRENYLRLCHRCAAKARIRRLYVKTAKWTPERDARIQALVERAKHGLPLFPDSQGARPCADIDCPTPSGLTTFPKPSAKKRPA